MTEEGGAEAMKKETFTARPKRTSDGAVNARYKRITAEEPEKKTARTANKTAAKTVKSAAEKKSDKPAARKAAVKTEKRTDIFNYLVIHQIIVHTKANIMYFLQNILI